MNKLILSGLYAGFLLWTTVLSAQTPGPALIVYFSSDSHTPSPHEIKRIDSFMNTLNTERVRDMVIKGFTDADAGKEYNEALSERRIVAVRNRMRTTDSTLTAAAEINGERNPVKPNDVETNKRWNRRVEVWVTYEPRLPHILTVLDGLNTFQAFCIDPSRDTILVGEDGTIIHIKANSFKVPSYQRSCLTFRLKEFLTVEDMLMAHLSTTSNGQILESGGMIYIDAIDPMGYQVPLKDNTGIQISIPTTNPVPGMGLFYGHEDSSGFVNWNGASNATMQIIDPNGILRGNNCMGYIAEGTDCPLFFCRIRKFVRRVMGRVDAITTANAGARDCGRTMDSLFKVHGVDNYEDYLLAINKDLMDSLNITTLDELQQYLIKKQEEENMERLQTGAATTDEVNYYAFSSGRMGWINCDRFSDMNLLAKTSFRFRLKEPEGYAISVVFPKIKSILAMYETDGQKITFKEIPAATRIYVVLIRNAGGGMVDLCVKETNTSAIGLDDFEFERLSLDALRERLAGL